MYRQQPDPLWLAPTDALSRFFAPDAASMPGGITEAAERFGFRVGALGFLADAGTYCEVVEQVRVYPLPLMPQWFSGLLNLRGIPAPVLDLRVLWGDAPADAKNCRLLAVGRGENAAALWIDGLPERHGQFSQALQQLPALPRLLQDHVGNGYFQHGRIWLEVQFDALFNALAGGPHARDQEQEGEHER